MGSIVKLYDTFTAILSVLKTFFGYNQKDYEEIQK